MRDQTWKLMKSSECTRHVDAKGVYSVPWRVGRCVHLGNRFVVQWNSLSGSPLFVDYVEDGATAIECYEAYSVNEASVDMAVESLVKRMLADDPPCKDAKIRTWYRYY